MGDFFSAGELMDKKIAEALRKAADNYENGELIEVRDLLSEIVGAINAFSDENTSGFAKGSEVWVLERDEDRVPCSVCGYMFLAQVGKYAIVTGWINDLDDVDEILEYHVEETWNNYDTDLAVFWMKDCYATQEEAHAVLGEASLCEEE